MKILTNHGRFPGVPEDSLIGEWMVNEQKSGTKFRLIALGDIGLSGWIARKIHDGSSVKELFSEISSTLHAADLVMANLETPLLDNWSQEKIFAGKSQWAGDLAEIGFDVFHMASNHMLDHGSTGFLQTIKAVHDSGIIAIGAGATDAEASQPVIHQIGNLRIGWLAAGHTRLQQPASPRFWELNLSKLLLAIKQLRSQVDMLFVSTHWGSMQVDYPYKEQYEAAHEMVGAGASAVLMHHAHIVQGAEIYSQIPICYSLGNCIFDPTEGLLGISRKFRHIRYREQITSCIFSLTWYGDQFSSLHAAPFVLPDPLKPDDRNFVLAWPSIPTAEQILGRLKRISEDLNDDFSKKLEPQLQDIRKHSISVTINLILEHHEYWRLWYCFRQIRWKHVKMLFGLCTSFLKKIRIFKHQ